MPGNSSPLVRGYHVKILDGNHSRRTERRIGELRELNVAPWPGHAIVISIRDKNRPSASFRATIWAAGAEAGDGKPRERR